MWILVVSLVRLDSSSVGRFGKGKINEFVLISAYIFFFSVEYGLRSSAEQDG